MLTLGIIQGTICRIWNRIDHMQGKCLKLLSSPLSLHSIWPAFLSFSSSAFTLSSKKPHSTLKTNVCQCITQNRTFYPGSNFTLPRFYGEWVCSLISNLLSTSGYFQRCLQYQNIGKFCFKTILRSWVDSSSFICRRNWRQLHVGHFWNITHL